MDYFIEHKELVNTVIEANTELDGDLFFETSLKIKGKFKGNIKSNGLLVIDKNAFVQADIKSKDIVIAGTVKGNVIATNKMEIESSGKLTGNIRTYKLKIADGVFFDGTCEMLPEADLLKLEHEGKKSAPGKK